MTLRVFLVLQVGTTIVGIPMQLCRTSKSANHKATALAYLVRRRC